jgi:hypothetical protein
MFWNESTTILLRMGFQTCSGIKIQFTKYGLPYMFWNESTTILLRMGFHTCSGMKVQQFYQEWASIHVL